MSLFKTKPAPSTPPAVYDEGTRSVEGVTLNAVVIFIARTSFPHSSAARRQLVAQALGFPEGRYEAIRAAWMSRIYASPALSREFGILLDEARASL